MAAPTLAQGVRALVEDLRRETSEWIGAGRGMPRYDGPWLAGRLEQLLDAHPAPDDTQTAPEALREAAREWPTVDWWGEFDDWLRDRADLLERA